jgi:hypothetical protein
MAFLLETFGHLMSRRIGPSGKEVKKQNGCFYGKDNLNKSGGYFMLKTSRLWSIVMVAFFVVIVSVFGSIPALTATIEDRIEAGGTIPAGTYTLTRKITLSKTSGITITANNVILDAKNLGSSADAVTVSGSNYTITGLTVKNAGHNGICVKGNNNTFTNVTTHSCGNTGFNIKGSAKNNIVTGCKSYNNYDKSTYGENADGFGVKDCTGTGNKFINCEAYNNSDDGWDFWGTTGAVTLTGCYAHDNGRGSAGDGNGFKLGESGVCGKHVLKNCTAKNNLGSGFTKNGNTCKISYTNCVSSGNKKADNW